jgi:serine protein kinase
MYDMIVDEGTENYVDFKKDVIRYKFFDDTFNNGKDAVFGLDVQLMKLVNVL